MRGLGSYQSSIWILALLLYCCKKQCVAIETLSNILLGLELFVVNASGLSGGLLSCWNPRVVQLRPFKTY